MLNKKVLFGLSIFLLVLTQGFAQENIDKKEYGSPLRYEKTIQKYEAADSANYPAKNAIVCVGSSSLGGWHGTIHEDLAPLTVIPRGFGGSNMNDALHYADRIIVNYRPRAVVIYEGDNDIAQGISPEQIHAKFQQLIKKIFKSNAECRIYFLSIKPFPSRWEMWPDMVKANNLIESECLKDARLTYVDVASVMLNEKGEPKQEIFINDNLHMNREGYILWRDVLRPVLIKNELGYEK